ncbi:CGLD27 family protein [Synechococcus sp. PCC 7336]|uniref:CGLD27 family protein n=1 Tax=Synechococcus sp. PCC 7336 TaxID=195250 RepID=UPI00034C85C1|nr:CGLD27 family protein [Synechococcus sp. PCC 7336]
MSTPLADELFPEPEPLHPVPDEQIPMREYENLRASGFFRWATLDVQTYYRRLGWIGFWSGAIVSPIAAASFPPDRQLAHLLLAVLGAGLASIVLATLRLYLGWSYIRQRLEKESIVYEESGWYDGETWVKPEEELAKDRLVVEYQVQPVLKRLYRTFSGSLAISALGAIVWPFV